MQALEFASNHAVLLFEDLRWLDADSKAALRLVCKGARSLVDGAVQVVASSSWGASANDLASALLRWPAIRELTLLNVSSATDLSPLTTATLSGLTSLTVRETVGSCALGTSLHPAAAWQQRSEWSTSAAATTCAPSTSFAAACSSGACG
ncbi:hypothetical protein FOA52_011117 [Chlamydomonas sp. UWO 241]|nr:hypothetical protein FOA52_011117 [Chlamydomonas sp. UWO 241]